ncbi:MAG: hypothetical protein WB683_03295 [Candidatus Sulfotelmatobacter sp.]
MKYLALAVLFVAMQASPPTPRKAADSSTAASGSAKQRTSPDRTATAEPQAPVNASPAVTRDAAGNQQGTSSDQHSVSVTKLPTVSVEPDWGMWLFSFLLVVVGAIQAGILYRTWGQIERQAGTMERQLTTMQGQLEAMKSAGAQTDELIRHAAAQLAELNTSATAAKRSAEFAELAVKVSECADVLLLGVSIKFATSQRLDGNSNVVFTFKNFGRTRANNTKFSISLILPEVPHNDVVPINVAIVIGASDTQVIGCERFREWLAQETFDKFLRGESVLRFSAGVTYEDVFGQPHAAPFAGFFDFHSQTFRVEENEAG